MTLHETVIWAVSVAKETLYPNQAKLFKIHQKFTPEETLAIATLAASLVNKSESSPYAGTASTPPRHLQ